MLPSRQQKASTTTVILIPRAPHAASLQDVGLRGPGPPRHIAYCRRWLVSTVTSKTNKSFFIWETEGIARDNLKGTERPARADSLGPKVARGPTRLLQEGGGAHLYDAESSQQHHGPRQGRPLKAATAARVTARRATQQARQDDQREGPTAATTPTATPLGLTPRPELPPRAAAMRWLRNPVLPT